MSTRTDDELQAQARRLGFWGLVENWETHGAKPWVRELLDCEEEERQRRSLDRRIRNVKLGRFKSISDFDWEWPKQIDQNVIEDVMSLSFVEAPENVLIIGPNGVGKTTIAQNIGYQALCAGHTVLRVTASEMLNDLAAQEMSVALARRLRRYCNPSVLIIDEIGYLSHDSRYGDLLFEVVSRRHESKPIVLTTNKPFSEWTEVFPNASCVTALVDRLVHRAEIIKIEGASYRNKEARERNEKRAAGRKAKAPEKARAKKP